MYAIFAGVWRQIYVGIGHLCYFGAPRSGEPGIQM
jgi:hypothetical protein